MTNAYTLDEVHEEINGIYRFFAVAAPGVTPVETDHLGALWSIADRLHAEEEG